MTGGSRQASAPKDKQFDTVADVADALIAAETINVVTHIRPDADAIGSACGLALGLRSRGKTVNVFIGQSSEPADNLRSIPGIEEITFTDVLPADGLIVTCDCASVDRTGRFAEAIAHQRDRVVVIDHHASNTGFGAVNLIEPVESTTVLIRDLLEHMGIALTEDIAYCLYAGLVTDTGSFRWGTPRMHTLAAELMTYGVNTRQAALDLMDEISAQDLKMMGSVMANMKTFTAGDYEVSVLVIDDERLKSMNQTAVEMIIQYARAIEGSDIGVVFKEIHPAYWSVSLRSSLVDVSVLAEAHGGGGHVPAAGYSVGGDVDDAIAALAATIAGGEPRQP
ncbi:DHH family phosphoesterase [Corynebacterium aquatimens]|uniref:Phosphoesterase RecJ-like protein n=1 Tax=Corynebacterium aquatimens TaxID=1190508 RepID=A0A931GXL0_9CORY|nr:bifunctional oligoribonuclease/PAP phosphatase NrnA [Corynebacterium aquatimens]MBG6121844.1 phosphoesterase RecJ-like protein [Corynebacterium aquatimens]WJY65618.1 Bifunctional oligoribonuclease and PAP phosphatase NrnA [Corynebacterium aquatimens]